jgi:hypothetical protein
MKTPETILHGARFIGSPVNHPAMCETTNGLCIWTLPRDTCLDCDRQIPCRVLGHACDFFRE